MAPELELNRSQRTAHAQDLRQVEIGVMCRLKGEVLVTHFQVLNQSIVVGSTVWKYAREHDGGIFIIQHTIVKQAVIALCDFQVVDGCPVLACNNVEIIAAADIELLTT